MPSSMPLNGLGASSLQHERPGTGGGNGPQNGGQYDDGAFSNQFP